jgi:hypothetical protein
MTSGERPEASPLFLDQAIQPVMLFVIALLVIAVP